MKRDEKALRLLLKTNMKYYTRFRLVPKLTNLDDLEGSLCILFQNTASFGAHHKKFEWR